MTYEVKVVCEDGGSRGIDIVYEMQSRAPVVFSRTEDAGRRTHDLVIRAESDTVAAAYIFLDGRHCAIRVVSGMTSRYEVEVVETVETTYR